MYTIVFGSMKYASYFSFSKISSVHFVKQIIELVKYVFW